MKIYQFMTNEDYSYITFVNETKETFEYINKIKRNEIELKNWNKNLIQYVFKNKGFRTKKLKKDPDIDSFGILSNITIEKISELKKFCNFFEVITDSKNKIYYQFNCPNKIDCLNFEKSTIDSDFKNGMYTFKKYEFDINKMDIDKNLIFTIPQNYTIFGVFCPKRRKVSFYKIA